MRAFGPREGACLCPLTFAHPHETKLLIIDPGQFALASRQGRCARAIYKEADS